LIKIEFTRDGINELEYERYNYPEPRVQRKMEVLYLKSQGLTHKSIRQICRISPVTIAKYLRQYQDGGIARLKLNLFKGKENELLPHQESLEEILTANPPHTTAEAAAIIERHTGIKRGLTQVREFLKSIGFKYRKTAAVPGKVAKGGLAKEQDEFRVNELEPLLAEAKTGAREVFFWMPPTSSTELS